MQYEICYLVGESREAVLDAAKQEVEKLIEAAGGKLLEGEWLEKKKLAYQVKKDIRGTYVARRFELEQAEEAGKDPIAELGRKLNLHTDILRAIIVKVEDLPALGTKIDVPVRHGSKKESAPRQAGPRDRRPASRPAPAPKAVPAAVAAPVSEAVPAEQEEVPAVKAEPSKDENIDRKLDEILGA